MLKREVWIRTTFVGFHRWQNADEKFLRDFHRHVFHVELRVAEAQSRGIEFIELKRRVDQFLKHEYDGKKFDKSCEEIAEHLIEAFKAHQVTVSEDGENGATVFESRYTGDEE